jgi:organic hydroperoxide reductase OsmC/OhrA
MSATAPARPSVAPFPHHYEVALEGRDVGGILSVAGRPSIAGGPPSQFGGRDDWWSPEDLLLSALSLCLAGTFQAFAAGKKLRVISYGSNVKGTLDRTPEGLRFTAIVLEVDLVVPTGEKERAESMLASAKERCIVANGLCTPVDLRPVVTEA